MRVHWLGVDFHDNRGFSIRLFKDWEFDDYQYLLNIQAFGRDFAWGWNK